MVTSQSYFPVKVCIYIILKDNDINRRTLYVISRSAEGPLLQLLKNLFEDSMITAINATGYGEGIGSMQRDLSCSALAVTAGLTSYLVLCAFAPLILAPISEQFGRRGMMLISSVIFTLCYLPQALAPNIILVIVFRGVQGIVASSGNR